MPFAHRPLDRTTGEIRLMSFLEPSEDNPEEISCTIEHVPYTDEAGWGEFVAISYVWGDTTESQYITLDEHRLEVRRNLFATLKGVRRIFANPDLARRTHRVWVDALCINQADVLERNHQVSRMRDIYSRAKTTYCFLPLTWSAEARDSEVIQQTLDCDDAVDMVSILHAGGDPPGKARLLTELRYATERIRLPPSTRRWYALYQFFTNPFWARVWIMQEIALSIDVQVVAGEHVVPWAVVVDAAYAVMDGYHPILALMMESALPLRLHTQPYWSVIASIEVLRMQRQGRFYADWNSKNSWVYIDLVSRAGCSDPRDKVYGILSLLPADWAKQIEVDYLRDLRAVYQNLIVTIINLTGNLAVLPRFSLPETVNFPSWMPDLRHSNLFQEFDCTAEADKGLDTSSPGFDRAQRLIVHGLRVDTIDSISNHLPRRFSIADTNSAFDESRSSHSCAPFANRSNEHMGDELARTLIPSYSDRAARRLPSTAWLTRHENSVRGAREALIFFTKHADFKLPNGTYLGDLMEHIEVLEKFEDYYESFVKHLDHEVSYRKLASTTKRRLAMVPPYARKGDAICVLKGLGALGVLRPADDQTWYWMGDCFIKGAMSGKELVGREDQAERFVLV